MDIKNKVYNKLQEYVNFSISDEKRLYKDLSIYGDDFEELIEELSNELNFDIYKFFDLFTKKGFYNPPETYIKLPKFFYLDLGKLFKGKVEFLDIDKKGKDITVGELIGLIEEAKKQNKNSDL